MKVHIIAADISDMAQCRELHRRVKKYSIDIFVNNAGFGVFGDLTDTDLDRELAELDVNVKAFHTLFKLFLQDFRKRDYGYILNTASSAGVVFKLAHALLKERKLKTFDLKLYLDLVAVATVADIVKFRAFFGT